MDSHKRNIVIALMVAMFLGAIEGTVVTTAVPSIARELQGFELISLVFSLYLLTSAISTPIYGKLSDLFGRKKVLSVGIVIFLLGSCLCGLSQNMYQLIAFRAIQGLGAGSIFTVTYTIVGDVFSLSERAKVQGWLGTVWGVASLAGPFLGGFFIDYLSWHWIFYINLPFGILSIILLQQNLKEKFEKRKPIIDYLGTVLLSAAIISLLYGILLSGGKPWYSPSTLFPIIIAVLIMVIFYFTEKKAAEPVIPFEIFTKSNTVVNIISFLISAVLIGADVYMPIYIQNVLGYGATISGLTMAPMSVAWLMASVILAKAIPKFGERIITVISTVFVLVGCGLLLTLNIGSSLIMVVIYAAIMGFGFGGAFTILTIVVQSSVGYDKRGAATAANSLLRTLGQTIGVSILGSLFNTRIIKYFSSIGISGIQPDNLYSASVLDIGITIEQIKISIESRLYIVFIGLILVTFVCLMMSFTMSGRLKKEAADD